MPVVAGDGEGFVSGAFIRVSSLGHWLQNRRSPASVSAEWQNALRLHELVSQGGVRSASRGRVPSSMTPNEITE
jgi:hypothetical protein